MKYALLFFVCWHPHSAMSDIDCTNARIAIFEDFSHCDNARREVEDEARMRNRRFHFKCEQVK